MSDDFFDGINRRVLFGRWINITSVQIDAICINSIVSSSNSIRIKDGKQIEYKFIS